jgi:hypothetical protein
MASLICPRRSSGQAARDGNRDRDPHPNETEGPGAVTRATSAGSAHPTQAKAAAVTGQAVTRGFAAAKFAFRCSSRSFGFFQWTDGRLRLEARYPRA